MTEVVKRRGGSTTRGIHAFDTEARSLEQACEILKWRQIRAKATQTKKSKPVSLKEQFAIAKARSRLLSISLAGGMTIAPKCINNRKTAKRPHPYRDLSEDDKSKKCREMYDDGNGFWGIGPIAFRRLAKLFAVSVGQIVVWCEKK